MSILYKINTATKKEIYNHLIICNDVFIPKLSSRTDISTFSDKIFKKTIKFEAWNNNLLVGLVSVYFNNLETQIGFINNVSILPEYHKNGIASKLIKKSEDYAKKNNFRQIQLEVNKNNISAINLYKKQNFNLIKDKGNFIIMKKDIED